MRSLPERQGDDNVQRHKHPALEPVADAVGNEHIDEEDGHEQANCLKILRAAT